MSNQQPAWADAITWDCERVRKFIDNESAQPLRPVAAAMLDAHLGTCASCRQLIEEEGRRNAPEWVRPWLSGEIEFAELSRRWRPGRPDFASWRTTSIDWPALPVAARGQSIRWPEIQLPLEDRLVLLVDGMTDRGAGRTTFLLRLGAGKRFPVIAVDIALVHRDGRTVTAADIPEPVRIGDVVGFAGVEEPHDVVGVRYRVAAPEEPAR